MVAHVIAIAQQKGGAGKTTLAAHLGVVLSGYGLSVAMVDVDPQGSLGYWYGIRDRIKDDQLAPLSFLASSGVRLGTDLRQLKQTHDFIIIDSPPHADTEARSAIRYADLVVIPMQPSPLDLWATQATLKMARQAKVPVKMVLNRVNPQAKLSQKMREEMKDMSLCLFGNRVAFASSLMAGKGISEVAPGSTATHEMEALADSILDYFGFEVVEDEQEAVA